MKFMSNSSVWKKYATTKGILALEPEPIISWNGAIIASGVTQEENFGTKIGQTVLHHKLYETSFLQKEQN